MKRRRNLKRNLARFWCDALQWSIFVQWLYSLCARWESSKSGDSLWERQHNDASERVDDTVLRHFKMNPLSSQLAEVCLHPSTQTFTACLLTFLAIIFQQPKPILSTFPSFMLMKIYAHSDGSRKCWMGSKGKWKQSWKLSKKQEKPRLTHLALEPKAHRIVWEWIWNLLKFPKCCRRIHKEKGADDRKKAKSWNSFLVAFYCFAFHSIYIFEVVEDAKNASGRGNGEGKGEKKEGKFTAAEGSRVKLASSPNVRT